MGCVSLLDGRIFDASMEHNHVSRARALRPSNNVVVAMLPTYRFQRLEIPTPCSRVLSWAQTLFGELPELWWVGEYKYTTPEERAEIEVVSGDYDDREGISSPWIETDSLEVDEFFEKPSLLWRTDVQCLALGILKMEWSPRGCLFDEGRGELCRRLLCTASSSLRTVLEASFRKYENSTFLTPDRKDLIGSIGRLVPMCTWRWDFSEFNRALHEELYDFEHLLHKVHPPDHHSMAIGVMFITSETFRNFILETLMKADSHSNILTLDRNSKYFTILAPGAFSNKKFALDFNAVFSKAPQPGLVSFTYEQVLFATLQACVRSVVFNMSLSSKGLLDFVGHMEEVVYVSSLPNVPLSRRNRARSHQF